LNLGGESVDGVVSDIEGYGIFLLKYQNIRKWIFDPLPSLILAAAWMKAEGEDSLREKLMSPPPW